MLPDRFVIHATSNGKFHDVNAGPYPGRIELYDIGETQWVGALYTAGKDRQVQPISWWGSEVQKKLLEYQATHLQKVSAAARPRLRPSQSPPAPPKRSRMGLANVG